MNITIDDVRSSREPYGIWRNHVDLSAVNCEIVCGTQHANTDINSRRMRDYSADAKKATTMRLPQ